MSREEAKTAKENAMGYGETTTPEHERIGTAVVDSSFNVHEEFGPGLLESAYEACLCYELRSRGFFVERQVYLPIRYRGIEIDEAYRIDLRINGLVIVEVKAVEQMQKVFARQLRTYMRLSNCQLGFLINFNVPLIKDGIQRIILTPTDRAL
jgi:GxxExxY protein